MRGCQHVRSATAVLAGVLTVTDFIMNDSYGAETSVQSAITSPSYSFLNGSCAPYSTSNSNNAISRYVSCSARLRAGDTVTFSSHASALTEASSVGDTYFRLYSAAGQELVANDNDPLYGGAASTVSWKTPIDQVVRLRQGCAGNSSCTGNTKYTIRRPDPIAPAACTDTGATLLFRSDFGQGVTLDARSGNTNVAQRIRGGDVSGFRWDNPPFGAEPTWFNNIINTTNTPAPLPVTAYLDDALVSRPGPYGSATRVLRLDKLADSPSSTVTQLSFNYSPMREPPSEFYVRYWLHLDPNVDAQARSAYAAEGWFWRLLWEYKAYYAPAEGGADTYRQGVYIGADPQHGGRAQLFVNANKILERPGQNAQFLEDWRDTSSDAPPLGRWVPFEVYVKYRNDDTGRFFVALDNKVLSNHYGPSEGANVTQIGSIFNSLAYGMYRNSRQYIDDFEVWNTLPCTTLPCGGACRR